MTPTTQRKDASHSAIGSVINKSVPLKALNERAVSTSPFCLFACFLFTEQFVPCFMPLFLD